nr:RNA-binding protein 1 [Tanacetum cinerariifolium]
NTSVSVTHVEQSPPKTSSFTTDNLSQGGQETGPKVFEERLEKQEKKLRKLNIEYDEELYPHLVSSIAKRRDSDLLEKLKEARNVAYQVDSSERGSSGVPVSVATVSLRDSDLLEKLKEARNVAYQVDSSERGSSYSV